MADLNNIVIIGRATKDTDLRTTAGGAKVATVTIANNRANDTADFFDVVFFDQRAEVAGKYVTKGKQIAISGRLQNRNFEDKNGAKQYRTEIAGYQLQLLGGGDRQDDRPLKQHEVLKDVLPNDDEVGTPIDLAEIPF